MKIRMVCGFVMSIVLISVLLTARPALASDPPETCLVKDVFPGSSSSEPTYFIEHDGILFFVANNGAQGYELWKSDGTKNGTSLIKDIWPGDQPDEFYTDLYAVVDDLLFFGADDGVHGKEMWKSDGTEAGTVLVKDIPSPVWGSNPYYLFDNDVSLLFQADGGLWASDGTESGTVLLAGVSGDRDSFEEAGTSTFFFADDGVHGYELWKTDSTPAGTHLVKDIWPGAESSGQSYGPYVRAFGDSVLFEADDGTHGRELWTSDGTPAGTTLIYDINPGSAHSVPNLLRPGVFEDVVLFWADDGVHGRELWKSDGTSGGTGLVRDIYAGPASSNLKGEAIWAVGDVALFAADDDVHGEELWKSDGTPDGTMLLKDIQDEYDYGSNTVFLAVVDETLYFKAWDGEESGLWRSDGTEAGTVKIAAVNSGSRTELLSDDQFPLWFSVKDEDLDGPVCTLWRSDGTEDSTVRVRDTHPFSEEDDEYTRCRGMATSVDGSLFFREYDEEHGRELWLSPTYHAVAGLAAENDGPTLLGEATAFTATITSGNFVTYTWVFGDGASGAGAATSHTYESSGIYTATVTASNSISETTADTVVGVNVGDLQGIVFLDKDGDGQQGGGEPGIAGALVELDSTAQESGTQSTAYHAERITDASGAYHFEFVVAGAYVLTVTPPEGYELGSADPMPVEVKANQTTTAPVCPVSEEEESVFLPSLSKE